MTEILQWISLALLASFLVLMFLIPIPNASEIFSGLALGVGGIWMACEAKLQMQARKKQLEDEWAGKKDE